MSVCQFQSIQLHGKNFGSAGVPTDLEVNARLSCSSVHIEVRRSSTDPTPLLSASGAGTSPYAGGSPPPGVPPRLLVHSFSLGGGVSVRCGEVLHLTIVCANDASCRWSGDVRVECKGFEGSECPLSASVSVTPALDSGADCAPAGNYLVAVSAPTGSDVSYIWMSQVVGELTSSVLPGGGVSQNIQRVDGDPPTLVMAIAMKAGCDPVVASVLFPAAHDEQCPSGFTVVLLRGGAIAAGPHTNLQGVHWDAGALASDFYTLRVTLPSGAETYEFFNNDGTLAATGASNEHTFGVNAGQTVTIGFWIKASDCCPALAGSVTITGTTPVPPDDGTDTPPPGDGTVETPPPVDTPPPPPWFCPVLGLLVGLALIVAGVSLVALGCPTLAPAALPTMIAALVAAGVLLGALALLCGLSWCRFIGIVIWALKWSVVLGAFVALGCWSLLSAIIVVMMGGATALLINIARGGGCTPPRMRSTP